jgi:hypothetical protein
MAPGNLLHALLLNGWQRRHCSQRFVQIKETGNAHLKSGLSHNLSLCTLAKTAQQTTRPSNPAGFCGDKRRTQQKIDPGYQRGNRWPIWPVCTQVTKEEIDGPYGLSARAAHSTGQQHCITGPCSNIPPFKRQPPFFRGEKGFY